jgi:hypothetical protein
MLTRLVHDKSGGCQKGAKKCHFLSRYGTQRHVGVSLIPMQWQEVTKDDLLGTFLPYLNGFVHSW